MQEGSKVRAAHRQTCNMRATWLVINRKILDNRVLMPFCFGFPADVEPRKWVDKADIEKGEESSIPCFLGRETHLNGCYIEFTLVNIQFKQVQVHLFRLCRCRWQSAHTSQHTGLCRVKRATIRQIASCEWTFISLSPLRLSAPKCSFASCHSSAHCERDCREWKVGPDLSETSAPTREFYTQHRIILPFIKDYLWNVSNALHFVFASVHRISFTANKHQSQTKISSFHLDQKFGPKCVCLDWRQKERQTEKSRVKFVLFLFVVLLHLFALWGYLSGKNATNKVDRDAGFCGRGESSEISPTVTRWHLSVSRFQRTVMIPGVNTLAG